MKQILILFSHFLLVHTMYISAILAPFKGIWLREQVGAESKALTQVMKLKDSIIRGHCFNLIKKCHIGWWCHHTVYRIFTSHIHHFGHYLSDDQFLSWIQETLSHFFKSSLFPIVLVFIFRIQIRHMLELFNLFPEQV